MDTKTFTLVTGQTVELVANPRIIGVHRRFPEVAVAQNKSFTYMLTPCCGATGTGGMHIDDRFDTEYYLVECRVCYNAIDDEFGGEVSEFDIIRLAS